MLLIDKINAFKKILSFNLLSMTLNDGLSIEAEIDQIAEAVKQSSADEAIKKEVLLERLNHLITALYTEEVAEAEVNKYIKQKILCYMIAGFIDHLTAGEDKILSGSVSENLIEQMTASDIYANNINKIAFDLGHMLFLSAPKDDDNFILQALIDDFKVDADALGIDAFKTRQQTHGPNTYLDNFHLMLQTLGKTGSQIITDDHENKENVPHRIHLIWNGGIPNYKENIASWKKENQSFNVVVYMDYTDELDSRFIEFKNWCIEQKILIVNIHEVISFSHYYPLFLDVNDAQKIYGASANNYGSSSDVARYIIESIYLGVYADIPDIRCIKAFPENFYGNQLVRYSKEGSNNDFMVAGNENAKIKLNKTLNKIEKLTLLGWPTLYKRGSGESLTTNTVFTAAPSLREVTLTCWRTGVNTLQDAKTKCSSNFFSKQAIGQPSSSQKLSLKDFIRFRQVTGSWISNNTEVQAPLARLPDTNSPEFVQKIEAGITGLLKDLRYYPYVINFDKYPIFSSPQAFKTSLQFLKAYFPQQMGLVENVIAYTTDENVLCANLDVFPNIYQPFIHVICKTIPDPSYRAMHKEHVIKLITARPDYLLQLDHHDNNIFMSSCRNGNFLLAIALMDRLPDDEILRKNADGLNAFDFCIGYINFYYENIDSGKNRIDEFRKTIINKMLDKGLKLSDELLISAFKDAVFSWQIPSAIFIFSKMKLESKVNAANGVAYSLKASLSNYVEKLFANKDYFGLNDEKQCKQYAKQIFLPLFQRIEIEAWDHLNEFYKDLYKDFLIGTIPSPEKEPEKIFRP